MAATIETDVCVIGAGAGGLTVAAGAAQMGAGTVLVERARMGGDCLNYGCVPSKSLLAAAHAADAARASARFGVGAAPPRVDFGAVHDHVQGVIDTIALQDSADRFEGLGVHVIQADARFVGPREIDAGEVRIRARRFVVATGSAPFVPPIPGLDEVPFETNESIFRRRDAPERLLIVGGGPIGVELAQAYRHLGAEVSVVEMADILPRDDPELVDVVRTRLRRDGIRLLERARVTGVERREAGIALAVERDDGRMWVEGNDLLIAVGRRPSVEGLGLEAAGIAYSGKGIEVDARLRTTNRRVFAVGDVAGAYQFTHVATYHAGIALRNLLFRLPARVDYRAVPWVTYADPELAGVGLDEAAARARHGRIRILRWPFAENDRAQAERTTDGLIKVVTTRRGRILGAAIVGPRAGELIHPWVLAIDRGLGIGAMARLIVPYPTLGEIGKRVAASYYAPSLFSDRTRRIVRFLARFG